MKVISVFVMVMCESGQCLCDDDVMCVCVKVISVYVMMMWW